MQLFLDWFTGLNAIEVGAGILVLTVAVGVVVYRFSPPEPATHYMMAEDGVRTPIMVFELTPEDDVQLGVGAIMPVADVRKALGPDDDQFDFGESQGDQRHATVH